MTEEFAQCCFCGLKMRFDDATQLIVYAPGEDEESQMLPCHATCLEKAVVPGTPILAVIDDAQE